jgi:hypothetical protein
MLWGTLQELEGTRADFMNSYNRIADRYVFESTIMLRFCRGNQKYAVQGWARDLSESGLGAFVAENLSNSDRTLWKRSNSRNGVSTGWNAIRIPIYSTKRRTTARDSSSVERMDSDSILARKHLIIHG